MLWILFTPISRKGGVSAPPTIQEKEGTMDFTAMTEKELSEIIREASLEKEHREFVRMNQLDDNLMTAIHEFIDAGGCIEFEITPNTSSYSNYIVWDCREDIETDFEGKTICFHINE